jgi:hypothetical protein
MGLLTLKSCYKHTPVNNINYLKLSRAFIEAILYNPIIFLVKIMGFLLNCFLQGLKYNIIYRHYFNNLNFRKITKLLEGFCEALETRYTLLNPPRVLS